MKHRIFKTFLLLAVLVSFINVTNAQQGDFESTRSAQEVVPACQGNRVDTCSEAKTQEQCEMSYRVNTPQAQCAWSGQNCYGNNDRRCGHQVQPPPCSGSFWC